MPELWNVMIHPSGRGSVGGRPRPAPRTQKPSVFKTKPCYNLIQHVMKTTMVEINSLCNDDTELETYS